MKTTVKENIDIDKEIKYPCLMEYEDMIILAIGYKDEHYTGVALRHPALDVTGTYREDWIGFKPYKGQVTLEND